jgi:hypothetical protein
VLSPPLAEAATALGRSLGARAPRDAPSVVVEETLSLACRRAAPGVVAAQAPATTPTRWWWVAYGAAWAVAAGATVVLAEGPGFPVPLIAGPVGCVLALLWAAAVLIVVRRWVRERHDETIAVLVGEVAAAALASARVEAARPECPEPADPLRPVWPRPGAQPYGVSHRGAEELIAVWMRHLGATDAEVTRFSGDGGVDVVSAHCIAQVKNLGERTTVPIAQLRELAGVAAHDGRRALFFTSGVYSDGGVAFADLAGMSLFEYHAAGGGLRAVNAPARADLAEGLRPPVRVRA